MSRNHCGV